MNELAVFLRSLNLGHYTRAMLHQGLDLDLLETLNDYELQVRKANRGRNQNDERRRDSRSKKHGNHSQINAIVRLITKRLSIVKRLDSRIENDLCLGES
eukprot:461873-Prorocentrum_minimum.AAC.1